MVDCCFVLFSECVDEGFDVFSTVILDVGCSG